MDRIEKSNLSRQFLFRTTDIGQSKSMTAAKAIQQMNKDMKITCYETKVCMWFDLMAVTLAGAETENIFTPSFWDSLDGVCNALDNVQARLYDTSTLKNLSRYNDKKCVEHQKCLLESGTLGAKGNTQVYITICASILDCCSSSDGELWCFSWSYW